MESALLAGDARETSGAVMVLDHVNPLFFVLFAQVWIISGSWAASDTARERC